MPATPPRKEPVDGPEDQTIASEQPKTQPAQPTASERPKAQPGQGTRYKVLSGGLTGADGAAHYKGDELTAEQIGDQARIDKLLARGAIEAV